MVNFTREDGPWTIHLKRQNLAFRQVELDTTFILCFIQIPREASKEFQVFGYLVGCTGLLFVLVDRLMLSLLEF